MSETHEHITCPFCKNEFSVEKPGNIRCPMCYTEFVVDDRLECVFVDPDNVRLPANGTVCPSCGLVQRNESKACMNCGVEINTAVH